MNSVFPAIGGLFSAKRKVAPKSAQTSTRSYRGIVGERDMRLAESIGPWA